MTSTIKDPRENFIANIDLASTRTKISIAPIILLCGGQAAGNGDDIANRTTQSLRQAVHDHVLTKSTKLDFELFLPEEITDWEFGGIFEDLISYEYELANVCTLIVIILESAGSIAELGAFSQNYFLKKKIIAIKSSHFNDASFIELGLLRYISSETEDRSNVKPYPWNVLHPHSISPTLPADIVSEIADELDLLSKTSLFDVENGAHTLTFICELLTLFKALKETELLEFLTQTSINITKSELKRKLFLLEKFKLIKKLEYGSKFYVRTEENFHTLSFGYKNHYQTDSLRVIAECLNFYTQNQAKHKNRLRAIGMIG
jgi:hypothetical protein